MTLGSQAATLADFSARRIEGTEESLARWLGKVVLVVNVASQCGYTPQYAGLQALQDRYGPRGLVVLGFPCNQFLGQEPGSSEDIQRFCALTYSVTFPLYEKIAVNARHAHPLFVWLKAAAPAASGANAVKWNFTKFLIDRQGRVVRRFAPATPPEEIAPDIEALL
jgi:glutathione peroxidase